MLAIARALIQDPELILLDEPSLGLSPKAIREVFGKLVEINREGIAVVIVEQNAKQAVGVAGRVFLLEQGNVVLHGGKEVLKNKKIREVYLGGE
jgi:ABC-type branched-subunit amino acid transport system ATPase component